MARIESSRIAFAGAACAAALAAAFAASGGDAPARTPAAPRVEPLSLVETLVLLRWGSGALDWNLPDTKGDDDARIPSRRP
jgi:hypothetical protein